MLLNADQLQKQLDKDEFQEVRSITAFWGVNNQFQKFIDLKFTLDYDSQMTDSTLFNTLDRSSTLVETNNTPTHGSGMLQMTDDADIRPIYVEEPMAEVQLTAECNIFAIGQ
ncbi:hypothetical protein Tco_0064212 [Tanacetum coccineum]